MDIIKQQLSSVLQQNIELKNELMLLKNTNEQLKTDLMNKDLNLLISETLNKGMVCQYIIQLSNLKKKLIFKNIS